jgi:hypothetical protein
VGIPFKRTGTREVERSGFGEIQAVFKAADINQSNGRRHRALPMFDSGARVREVNRPSRLLAAHSRVSQPLPGYQNWRRIRLPCDVIMYQNSGSEINTTPHVW